MTAMNLLITLRTGGQLKYSQRTQRFFLVRDGQYYPADQTEAQRLAERGALRPHGIDSHGHYVFALQHERAGASA